MRLILLAYCRIVLCWASFSKTKKNFAIRQWTKWWCSERGPLHYPVSSEWKGTREETAILKWVDLQWDYIDLWKASFFSGTNFRNLLATSRSSAHKGKWSRLIPIVIPLMRRMLLCRKTSSLSRRDCRKDHVSQPQRRRFIGITRTSKYLL